MSFSAVITQVRVWVLGAINGLIVGLVTEEMRVLYVANELSRAVQENARQENFSADFFYPNRESLVPFVCIIAFAGVSHLVHQYFINRPRHLRLICWVLVVFAVSARSLMEARSPDLVDLGSIIAFVILISLAYRLWTNHPASLAARWIAIGTSAVIVVLASTQLIGLFMVQRRELRNPSVWLLSLTVVMVLNAIFGAIVQLIFSRYSRIESKFVETGVP